MSAHSPASQETMEKLEKIQQGENPEEIHALVEELEQHHFFTNEDQETVEAQIAIREKIGELLGNFKIINHEQIHGRLKKLHEKLEKSIETKKMANQNTASVPTNAPAVTVQTPSTTPSAGLAAPITPSSAPTSVPNSPSASDPSSGSPNGPGGTPPTRPSGPGSGPPKGPKTKNQASPAEALIKEVLANPDDLSRDSKNPVILAIIDQIKNLDATNLSNLTLSLSSSEKVPTPSQIKKIADVKKENINTLEELDGKIVELEEKLELLEGEIGEKEIKFREYKEIIGGKKGNASPAVEKAFDTLNTELAAKNKEKLGMKSTLKRYKEVQPLMGGNKISPRQLLFKIIEAKNPGQNKNLRVLGEKADVLIAAEEKRLSPSSRKWSEGWNQLDKYTQLIKPSLRATLAEFAKIEQLEGMKPEELEELVKLRKNAEGLSIWIDKLKDKAKTVVPTLMAYLQVAIVEGKLNGVSRGQAMDLLKNLRSVRNKRILKQVNGKPELLNAKPQVRMQAYLAEMNEWDEKSVQVNREIIEDLIHRSYASKLSKLAVGGVALGVGLPALSSVATFLGFSPITLSGIFSALSWGTLGKIGLVGAHFGVKKGVKTFKPEYEKWYKHIGPRLVGLGLLGPIGLVAPELISGTKFLFKKREDIKKGATTTGKAAATTAGATWAVTKGTAKALAWPFKKIFGKKSAPSAEPTRKAA